MAASRTDRTRIMMMAFPDASAPVNKESIKHLKPEERTNRLLQVLKTAHAALSVVYDGIETDEDNSILDEDNDGFSSFKDELTVPQTADVFTECCQSLVVMLSEPSTGQVRLPLAAMLNVISRCLRVSYADVKSVPSMTWLADLLPTIHQSALGLVSQLLVSCKTGLLPQSRTITDLCLQALTSATSMDSTRKSQTRAYAYQALSLLVQTLGWGRYLACQSKLVTQELISDIKWQDTNQTCTAASDKAKQDGELGRQKKGKKRKKNKAESYSELAVTPAAAEDNSSDHGLCNVEATLGALELSRLVLEREGFSSVENLMRSILDTTMALQRENPQMASPYLRVKCRRGLYSAVFGCVTVKLGLRSGRKDTITHFQMSNLALSLLNDASHLDSSCEVRFACQQALNVLRMTGNLNRPIVRRILPDENNDTKDVTELEREIENLSDENERLKKRLLESEMENQGQNRIIAGLKQEMEALKKAAVQLEETSVQGHQRANKVEAEATRESSHDHSEDEEEEEAEEEEEQEEEAEDDSKDVEREAPNANAAVRAAGEMRAPSTAVEKVREVEAVMNQKKRVAGSFSLPAEMAASEREATITQAGQGIPGQKKKRALNVASEDSVKRKKSKGDMSRNKNNNDIDSSDKMEEPIPSTSKAEVVQEDDLDNMDSVQAMIADFVDTEPDVM